MVRKHIFTFALLIALALLVAAWILNFFGMIGIGTRSGNFDYHYTFTNGSASIAQEGNYMKQGVFWIPYPAVQSDMAAEDASLRPLRARLRFSSYAPGRWHLQVPIILLITAIIPLLVGSLSRFRFRLWQLFAFTAVVAVELAYFLR